MNIMVFWLKICISRPKNYYTQIFILFRQWVFCLYCTDYQYKKGAKQSNECAKKNPPTVTDRKLNTKGGSLSFMMELNVGKYKVTHFTCDRF